MAKRILEEEHPTWKKNGTSSLLLDLLFKKYLGIKVKFKHQKCYYRRHLPELQAEPEDHLINIHPIDSSSLGWGYGMYRLYICVNKKRNSDLVTLQTRWRSNL